MPENRRRPGARRARTRFDLDWPTAGHALPSHKLRLIALAVQVLIALMVEASDDQPWSG